MASASPAAATAVSVPSLDFESLFSRDYRPARVSRLVPRDLYDKPTRRSTVTAIASISDDSDASRNSNKREQEETSRLVRSLVTHTPAFLQHLSQEEQLKQRKEAVKLLQRHAARRGNNNNATADSIAPAFHLVNLTDWERNIQWDIPDEAKTQQDKSESPSLTVNNPWSILQRPRNPRLDSLTFDRDCMEGDSQVLLKRAQEAPLILEFSVAGQSVARHVYQHTVLTAQRPTPATQTDEYQNRLDRDWSAQPITSTADVSRKGSLHADKAKMEALIAERQKKRAEMAKDKTNRVLSALGTLAMGGGRGRTITSSLMGPGGTERTGRPSKHMGSTINHEAEYVEQLELVNSVRYNSWKIMLCEQMGVKHTLTLFCVYFSIHWFAIYHKFCYENFIAPNFPIVLSDKI
jgi:hypothetical protein